MIGALAEAGAALGEQRFLEAAVECADFVLGTMRDDRRPAPAHATRTARRSLNAYLEDHAYLLEALLDPLRGDASMPRYYDAAVEIAETMIERFADPEHGGFFTTSHDHE